MDTQNNQRQLWLLILLVVNIIASILHYADNLIFFDQYPEPTWFTPYITDSLWLIMTPFGLLGYFQYTEKAFNSAYICLYIYVLMSQITLGNYTGAPIWQLSLKMNFLILLESLIALPLLAFVMWSQFKLKENQSSLIN